MGVKMATSSAYTLNMIYGDQVIGTLSLSPITNLLTLNYNEQWQKTGFAVSPNLPLNSPHSAEVAYHYLDNALPEGEARKLLADNIGVSEKNVYSQVRVIGNDLAGAFTFTTTSNTLETKQAFFRLLEENELTARLDNKEEIGLVTWDNKPRLSVAGVQDKLNVFINESGEIGFGDGLLCSTHILKFEKKNCKNLVLNEFFCMKLSTAIGLPTAQVGFKRFGSHPALVVERFDRKYYRNENTVKRRHVIDGCQALNLPRDYKYERNFGDGRDVKHIRDGVSLAKLFEFCQQMKSHVASKQWLVNWQSFNLMINNFDSHGKNISLFFDKNNATFTPAYDLVNIAMFPQFKHVLSMAMGDEFEPDCIHAYQLADFAETCNINKKYLSKQLINLADKVLIQLANNLLINSLKTETCFTANDIQYFQQVSDNIKTRTNYLKAQALDITNITV